MAEKKEEFIKIKANWNIPYTHSAGKCASHFFQEMREKKRILGIRCPKCQRVMLPPRSFCERCFVETTDWVPVKDEGVVDSVSINYMEYTGMPKPPYAIAFIKLDGSDSRLMHFVGWVDLSDWKKAKDLVKIGTRVKAVWKEEREGRMTDIMYFKPISAK